MTDTELITYYMRLIAVAEAITLEVAIIVWIGPHEPRSRWNAYHTWPDRPSKVDISEMQLKLLADPDFFRQCRYCRERLNTGHMHNQDTCQGCAERFPGVVH